jgi:hypothetical protein
MSCDWEADRSAVISVAVAPVVMLMFVKSVTPA